MSTATTLREETLQIPALGRPFDLGMLYDARSDRIVPGITLWNHSTLQTNIAEESNYNSNFKVLYNDTLTAKTSALDISAELKLSFLAGLFPIDGTGKYLTDNVDNSSHERNTLLYKSTTHWKKLGMDHLKNEKVEHQFEDNIATHVVTQIQYGADAFFLFDRLKAKKTDKKEISGSVNAKYSHAKIWEVGGGGKFDNKENEEKSEEKYECTYYGDFVMSSFPKNLKEAEEFAQDIHKKLESKPVPKIIYLYPLSKMNTSAPRILHHISMSLLAGVEELLQAIMDTRSSINSMLREPNLKYFGALEKEISAYLLNVNNSENILQQKYLCDILPRIRGGDGKEEELAKVLLAWNNSIFSSEMMTQMVQNFKKELHWLTNRLQSLKRANIEIVTDTDEIYSDDGDVPVLALEFHLIEFRSNLVEQCKKFIANQMEPFDHEQAQEPWIYDEELRQKLDLKVKRFISCATSTGNRKVTDGLFLKPTRFVCISNMPKTKKGKKSPELPIMVVAYKNGSGTDIELPFFEEGPEVLKMTSTSAELTWKTPVVGMEHITAYLILAKENDGEYKTQTYIHKFDCEDTTMSASVTGLNPATTYCFKIQPATQWGLPSPSPESTRVTMAAHTTESNLVMTAIYCLIFDSHRSEKPLVNSVMLREEVLRTSDAPMRWRMTEGRGGAPAQQTPKIAEAKDIDTTATLKSNKKATAKDGQQGEEKKLPALGLCDECYKKIAHGFAFKCTECKDVTICSSCSEKGEHAKHKIKKLGDKQKENDTNILHPAILCDASFRTVRGIRYKCASCPNYNLCNACKKLGEHDHHEMLSIIKP